MNTAIVKAKNVTINDEPSAYPVTVEYSLEIETKIWGVKSVYVDIVDVRWGETELYPSDLRSWEIEKPDWNDDMLHFAFCDIDTKEKTIIFN